MPGSRQGEVGELVCVITGTPDGGRAATFQQVVGEEPGRAVVTRALSVVAEHAWERALHVEALPDGSRVTHRVRVPVHRRQVAATRAAWTADAQRYLGAIEAALVANCVTPSLNRSGANVSNGCAARSSAAVRRRPSHRTGDP